MISKFLVNSSWFDLIAIIYLRFIKALKYG